MSGSPDRPDCTASQFIPSRMQLAVLFTGAARERYVQNCPVASCGGRPTLNSATQVPLHGTHRNVGVEQMPGSPSQHSRVILAVDDSASMRQMVRFTLESAGYKVVQAVDG